MHLNYTALTGFKTTLSIPWTWNSFKTVAYCDRIWCSTTAVSD